MGLLLPLGSNSSVKSLRLRMVLVPVLCSLCCQRWVRGALQQEDESGLAFNRGCRFPQKPEKDPMFLRDAWSW